MARRKTHVTALMAPSGYGCCAFLNIASRRAIARASPFAVNATDFVLLTGS